MEVGGGGGGSARHPSRIEARKVPSHLYIHRKRASFSIRGLLFPPPIVLQMYLGRSCLLTFSNDSSTIKALELTGQVRCIPHRRSAAYIAYGPNKVPGGDGVSISTQHRVCVDSISTTITSTFGP